MSKPVTAAAVSRIVDARGLAMGQPFGIRGWRAPPGITLTRLLSHTAGLSVPGYLGMDPGRPLPSTLDELNGRGEADAVTAIEPAGRGLRYSGGGYLVV